MKILMVGKCDLENRLYENVICFDSFYGLFSLFICFYLFIYLFCARVTEAIPEGIPGVVMRKLSLPPNRRQTRKYCACHTRLVSYISQF